MRGSLDVVSEEIRLIDWEKNGDPTLGRMTFGGDFLVVDVAPKFAGKYERDRVWDDFQGRGNQYFFKKDWNGVFRVRSFNEEAGEISRHMDGELSPGICTWETLFSWRLRSLDFREHVTDTNMSYRLSTILKVQNRSKLYNHAHQGLQRRLTLSGKL